MDKVAGVIATTSGYAGGTGANPNYKSHAGYVEAVRVDFDPARIGYRELADRFLRTIDVTDGGGQFCDRGDSYKPVLFVKDARQKAAAETALKRAAKALGTKTAVPVRPFTTFVKAEANHQDYYLGRGRVFTRFGFIRQADAYKRYRKACGRDARVRDVWGAEAYAIPDASETQ
jgi:peptide-methionine (S)-S-oxide reductase